MVSPLDALRVINFISRASGTELAPRAVGESQYVDVNNDSRATGQDALVVINYLARLARARLPLAVNLTVNELTAPEGESSLSPPISPASRVSNVNAVVDEAVLGWLEGDEVAGSSVEQKHVDPSGWPSPSTDLDDVVDDLELSTSNKPSDEDVDLALMSSVFCGSRFCSCRSRTLRIASHYWSKILARVSVAIRRHWILLRRIRLASPAARCP
jgi:hypothetical protein